jgi:hypothetical protein
MKDDDVAERLLEFGATVISAQQTSADRNRATPWCQVPDSRHVPCLFIIAGSRLPVRHYFEPERWPTYDSVSPGRRCSSDRRRHPGGTAGEPVGGEGRGVVVVMI